MFIEFFILRMILLKQYNNYHHSNICATVDNSNYSIENNAFSANLKHTAYVVF